MRSTHVERAEPEGRVVPLSSLGVGEHARIVLIACPTQGSLERIASLGVVPGKQVRLVHKRPSVVFEAGHTTVAVDREIADAIYVRRMAEA